MQNINKVTLNNKLIFKMIRFIPSNKLIQNMKSVTLSKETI